MSTQSVGNRLRQLREENKLPLRKVAAMLDVDTAILSKMERSVRNLNKEIIRKLSDIYNVESAPLIVQFLSEKIVNDLQNEPLASQAISYAGKSIKSKRKSSIKNK
jgi:transcriptional regulator with XRE-family HTH domain